MFDVAQMRTPAGRLFDHGDQPSTESEPTQLILFFSPASRSPTTKHCINVSACMCFTGLAVSLRCRLCCCGRRRRRLCVYGGPMPCGAGRSHPGSQVPRLVVDLAALMGCKVSTEEAKAACRELDRCGEFFWLFCCAFSVLGLNRCGNFLFLFLFLFFCLVTNGNERLKLVLTETNSLVVRREPNTTGRPLMTLPAFNTLVCFLFLLTNAGRNNSVRESTAACRPLMTLLGCNSHWYFKIYPGTWDPLCTKT